MVENVVTPWEVKGAVDYDKLIAEFGLKPLPGLSKKFDHVFFRRRIVFAHRDFERVVDAVDKRQPFVMMTGLMPSGKFHFGHKMVADQMRFYQALGAKLYVTVADVEAYNTRIPDLKELHHLAIEEYLVNYIALGLKPKNLDFYFQSRRSKDGRKSSAYYSLAGFLARHATFNEFQAVYGEITPGKMASSLLQAADMLHPQLPEFEGPVPVVVPVGVDQDPHIRLARDIASRFKLFPLLQLSSTYHLFLPGLKGGKMSSSDPTSFIALTDSPEEAESKIRKHAFSGGQPSVEEHRKKGGNPDVDVPFQMLRYGLEEDDKKLARVYDDYKSGKLLTSELKQMVIDKVKLFLVKHQKERERARKKVDVFLRKNGMA
ncbi:tryptophan--tRNA ligase [Candidatus Woesearchaeota archaeon]|nr:tryptophan--tRNA ligase [Candidatus Woesearchaeota archaeon]